jgi:hypothetical protein
VKKTATNVLLVTPPPGKWTLPDSREALAAFERLMSPDGAYVFVADLTLMTDYESGARTLWQEMFARRARQLRSLWVVAPALNPVVRMGLAAVSMILRRRFHVARTLADVPELASYTVPGPRQPP